MSRRQGGHSLRPPQEAPAGGRAAQHSRPHGGSQLGRGYLTTRDRQGLGGRLQEAVRAQRPPFLSGGRQQRKGGKAQRCARSRASEAAPGRARLGAAAVLSGGLGSPATAFSPRPLLSAWVRAQRLPARVWCGPPPNSRHPCLPGSRAPTSSLSRTPAPLPPPAQKNRGTEPSPARGGRTLARPCCDRSWSRPAALWNAPYQSRGSRQARAAARGRPLC